MKDYLKNLDINIDKKRLLQQALEIDDYHTFEDPLTGNKISNWQIKKINDGYGWEISEKIKHKFNLRDCRPRFYMQEAHSIIPFHKDRGTMCSINVLLSDGLAPITFRDVKLYYNTALLNTQQEHAVYNEAHDRILYKISIFDKSYQDMYDILPYKVSI